MLRNDGPGRHSMRRTAPLLATLAISLTATVSLMAGCTASTPPAASRHLTTTTASAAPGTGHSSATARPRTPVPTARTTKIAAALASTKARTVNAVLAPGTRPAGPSGRLLPPGARITVTGAATGHGNLASVPVTLSGTTTGTWLLLLVKIHGQWLTYGTRRAH